MHWSIIILLALSLACSKKEAPAPAAEGAEQTATPPGDLAPPDGLAMPTDLPPLPPELEAETPPLGTPPVVKLLEPGQEPRQALRWNVKPGFEQKVSTDLGFAIEGVVAVIKVGSPEVVLSYDLTMQAKKVEGNGTVRVAFTADWAMKGTKASGKLTGSYGLGPRGRMTDIEIKTPAGAPPANDLILRDLQWALIEMTPVFPEEPVGQGAKWTVHEGIEQGGVHINQLTTMEIVKVDGGRVELAMEARQSAASQPFKNPGAAMTMQLTTWSGVFSSALTWDLAELAPRAANIDVDVLKVGRVEKEGKRAEAVIKTDRTIKVTDH